MAAIYPSSIFYKKGDNMDNTTQRHLIYLLDRIATALEKIAGIEQEGDDNDDNNEENVNDTHNI